MKLKEKLAEEFITERYPRAHLNRRQSYLRATFIAGFEKARAIIADQFKIMPDIRKDILEIGEEEVE